jgi:hypothetical protein
MSKQIGLDMKLYYDDGGGWDSEDWVEITNVRDLTGPDSMGEADVGRRAFGNKQTEPTLRDVAIEWESVYDPSDTAFMAIKAAYYGKTLVELALADGDITTNGTIFTRIETKILKFERSEQLAGGNYYSISAKPCWGARTSLETVSA